MIKRIKKTIKKIGKAYLNGMAEVYKPVIDNKVNPFI